MRALMHTAFFALISSLLVSMNMAQAGEDALYAAEAPDGAAFIRVVNADASGAIARASVGDKVIKEVSPLEASPYIYLSEGTFCFFLFEVFLYITIYLGRFIIFLWITPN